MIQITDKHNCCGCGACGDICPKQAISFTEDNEGFWYPEVKQDKCIDCGLCEKVCPFQNEHEPKKPLQCYAAVNPDENVRLKSSSGGIFSLLMERIFDEGGVVFGAAFDNKWNVFHTYAQSKDEANKFRGSKYVQSRVEGCYKEVEVFLKQGKRVLFSGTACQVTGLKNYLRKDYDNLLTVDIVCHGVPSPKIWHEYVSKMCLTNNKTISFIDFREKSNGWVNYNFHLKYSDGTEYKEPHNKNLFMMGFLHDLYLRPSCYICKVKSGRCGSDITLGDFWGIWNEIPEIDDHKGISLVLANSEKGKDFINQLNIKSRIVQYAQGVKYNPCIEHCSEETPWRSFFMEKYQKENSLSIISYVVNQMQPSLWERIKKKIRRMISSFLN